MKTKWKSLILYGSDRKLTNAHRPVGGFGKQPEYFVRVELFNADTNIALDNAVPMEGEVVLNTVEI